MESNPLLRMLQSRKYVAAIVLSIVIIAANKYANLGLDAVTVLKSVCSMFGLAIAGNAFEDGMSKR